MLGIETFVADFVLIGHGRAGFGLAFKLREVFAKVLPHDIGIDIHTEAGELRVFGKILAAVEPGGPVGVGIIGEQKRRMAVFGDYGMTAAAAAIGGAKRINCTSSTVVPP